MGQPKPAELRQRNSGREPLLPAMRRRAGVAMRRLRPRQCGGIALLRAMRRQARRSGDARRPLPLPARRPRRRAAGRARRDRRRTPPAHGDVLRSGRLDRAVDPARSGRFARGHRRLSQRRSRRRHPVRRLCREIHGRRRAGLFRLSGSARSRRRKCRARRPRAGRRHRQDSSPRAAIRCASASPPAWSWSANWSAPATRRRSATSSARRRTSRRGCNRPRRRIRS